MASYSEQYRAMLDKVNSGPYFGPKSGAVVTAAGKLGGRVYMVGCVGNDLEGKQLFFPNAGK